MLGRFFLPLFRLKSHFTSVLPHMKNCNFALPLLPKTRKPPQGSRSPWSWGNELRWVAVHIPVIKSNQTCPFFFPGVGLDCGPAHSLFSLPDSVRCGHSCLAGGYAPWLCSSKPVSHMFSVCWINDNRSLLELLGG